jgi:hypothetical protein
MCPQTQCDTMDFSKMDVSGFTPEQLEAYRILLAAVPNATMTIVQPPDQPPQQPPQIPDQPPDQQMDTTQQPLGEPSQQQQEDPSSKSPPPSDDLDNMIKVLEEAIPELEEQQIALSRRLELLQFTNQQVDTELERVMSGTSLSRDDVLAPFREAWNQVLHNFGVDHPTLSLGKMDEAIEDAQLLFNEATIAEEAAELALVIKINSAPPDAKNKPRATRENNILKAAKTATLKAQHNMELVQMRKNTFVAVLEGLRIKPRIDFAPAQQALAEKNALLQETRENIAQYKAQKTAAEEKAEAARKAAEDAKTAKKAAEDAEKAGGAARGAADKGLSGQGGKTSKKKGKEADSESGGDDSKPKGKDNGKGGAPSNRKGKEGKAERRATPDSEEDEYVPPPKGKRDVSYKQKDKATRGDSEQSDEEDDEESNSDSEYSSTDEEDSDAEYEQWKAWKAKKRAYEAKKKDEKKAKQAKQAGEEAKPAKRARKGGEEHEEEDEQGKQKKKKKSD